MSDNVPTDALNLLTTNNPKVIIHKFIESHGVYGVVVGANGADDLTHYFIFNMNHGTIEGSEMVLPNARYNAWAMNEAVEKQNQDLANKLGLGKREDNKFARLQH